MKSHTRTLSLIVSPPMCHQQHSFSHVSRCSLNIEPLVISRRWLPYYVWWATQTRAHLKNSGGSNCPQSKSLLLWELRASRWQTWCFIQMIQRCTVVKITVVGASLQKKIKKFIGLEQIKSLRLNCPFPLNVFNWYPTWCLGDRWQSLHRISSHLKQRTAFTLVSIQLSFSPSQGCANT